MWIGVETYNESEYEQYVKVKCCFLLLNTLGEDLNHYFNSKSNHFGASDFPLLLVKAYLGGAKNSSMQEVSCMFHFAAD